MKGNERLLSSNSRIILPTVAVDSDTDGVAPLGIVVHFVFGSEAEEALEVPDRLVHLSALLLLKRKVICASSTR